MDRLLSSFWTASADEEETTVKDTVEDVGPAEVEEDQAAAAAAEEAEEAEEEEEEEEEEEVVDPRDVLMDKCGNGHHCAALKEKMAECTARVEGKERTRETCTEELFDFLACVDHCVSASLFKHLK